MKRTTLLKILNPFLGLLLINQAATGIFHKVLSHELFEIFHAGCGLVLFVIGILHLILNWNWVKANFFINAQTKKP